MVLQGLQRYHAAAGRPGRRARARAGPPVPGQRLPHARRARRASRSTPTPTTSSSSRPTGPSSGRSTAPTVRATCSSSRAWWPTCRPARRTRPAPRRPPRCTSRSASTSSPGAPWWSGSSATRSPRSPTTTCPPAGSTSRPTWPPDCASTSTSVADRVAAVDTTQRAEAEVRRFLTSRPPRAAGGLRDRVALADGIGADTLLHRRAGVPCRLVRRARRPAPGAARRPLPGGPGPAPARARGGGEP